MLKRCQTGRKPHCFVNGCSTSRICARTLVMVQGVGPGRCGGRVLGPGTWRAVLRQKRRQHGRCTSRPDLSPPLRLVLLLPGTVPLSMEWLLMECCWACVCAVAFSNIRRFGKGLAYFPALSISHGEHSTLNFGATPFQYPVEGFRPLQDPPRPAVVAQVTGTPLCSGTSRQLVCPVASVSSAEAQEPFRGNSGMACQVLVGRPGLPQLAPPHHTRRSTCSASCTGCRRAGRRLRRRAACRCSRTRNTAVSSRTRLCCWPAKWWA